MAHPEQRQFFAGCRCRFPQLFSEVSVLEIGSLDINGTLRDFFDASIYVGVDVGPGPGVDVVAQGQELDCPPGSFDVVVSAECFEHNPWWLETFANMQRIASRAVLFSCASTGRAEHGTRRTTLQDSPLTVDWDYYRNLSADDFLTGFDMDDLFERWEFTTNETSHDLYFWGLKGDV